MDNGYQTEVFTYDSSLRVPEWVTRRDAREILPTDRVFHYQSGFGSGSPSLHSNLFRYLMLKTLGGWWFDLDILLLTAKVPQGDFFFCDAPQGGLVFVSVLKSPQQHPILAEAAEQARIGAENDAAWGETGPQLWTNLVKKHDLAKQVLPASVAYPLAGIEVVKLFDPGRCDEVMEKCAGASFVHFFNEQWRDSGIPQELGPPKGSFLDQMFMKHDTGAQFSSRMAYANVERWIGNRNRCIILEHEQRALEAKLRTLEARWASLEENRQKQAQ